MFLYESIKRSDKILCVLSIISNFLINSFRVFRRYQELAPDIIPFDMTTDESSRLKVPVDIIENMPELKVSIV